MERTTNEWQVIGGKALWSQNPIWIVSGQLEGYSSANKFGLNTDVDTGSTPEDLWGNGGLYTGFPVSDVEPIEVLSSSADDAAAGTGLRTVTIQGLDADWNRASETLTLDGVTPVQSVNTYRRVHTMQGVTAGSGGFNVGTITVRHATTETNIFLVMQPLTNQTNCSGFTVPANHSGYLLSTFGSLRGSVNGTADCVVATRNFGSVFRYRRPFAVTAQYNHNITLAMPIFLQEKTDIIIRCTVVSANNQEIAGGYDLLIVENTML